MNERERLTNEIYRLRRLCAERKDKIKTLQESNSKMKRETRMHLSAMKVQLKQTQHELRKRIEREMNGALLDPAEVQLMMKERHDFQDQIEALEKQLATLQNMIIVKQGSNRVATMPPSPLRKLNHGRRVASAKTTENVVAVQAVPPDTSVETRDVFH